MKKFCSACGSQLELSQRFCAQCGTVNPFFVPAFTLLSDQTSVLDKLREEKERIEKELQQKEEAQQEFLRQENLRKQKEETERKQILLEQQKLAAAEIAEKERLLRHELEKQKQEADRLLSEKLQQEQAEREKSEAKLQQEILRIREETEQQKKQTSELVNEVREGLQHIDEQNQKLKDKLEILQQQIPETQNTFPIAVKPVSGTPNIEEPVVFVEQPITERTTPKKRRAAAILLLVLFTAIAFAGIYFLNNRPVNELPAEVAPTHETEQMAETTTESTVVQAEPVVEESSTTETEVAVAETKNEQPAEPISAIVETPKPIVKGVTEQQIITDLSGKRLSGCDVIIGSGEIESLTQLTLIEKLPSGLQKYKCMVTLKQKSTTYYAMPYVYYNADGSFARVDGANCE